jgi:hypothetical protein
MLTRCLALALVAAVLPTALAAKFYLLTGVDAELYPGEARTVVAIPGPGVPGPFSDGDRLAGTSDVGGTVAYQGIGTPLYAPNAFGSLSMLYRRGSVPLTGGTQVPFMGIEFLGGPLLDLDGDLDNGTRSLVPVPDATPVEIPGSDSYIDLSVARQEGQIFLNAADILGTNEAGPFIAPGNATILVTLAGTTNDGTPGQAINPDIDTRVGALAPLLVEGPNQPSIYGVFDLGYELWEDAIEPTSSTADVLGTMQFLGRFNGWYIERDLTSGDFPALTGIGLGTTLWPAVDASAVGQTFATGNGLAGGSATITAGIGNDTFTAPNNGGLPLSDFGGDLGAYLDQVVVPLLGPEIRSFVYLESAGFGINNSFDPVFQDTVGYDAVIIAAEPLDCTYQAPGDTNCDGAVDFFDIDPFVTMLVDPAAYAVEVSYCEPRCVGDLNGDGAVNFFDIDPFVTLLVGE